MPSNTRFPFRFIEGEELRSISGAVNVPKTPKSQAPNPKQAPISENSKRWSTNYFFDFGIWNFLGIWGLELGVSVLTARLTNSLPRKVNRQG
jgi:hypothetical protein